MNIFSKVSSVYRKPDFVGMKKIKRAAISLFLMLHISAIFFNNLSWSPLIGCLYPYYHPYIQWTGQTQAWEMYKNPDKYDQQIVHELVLSNGHRKQFSVTLNNCPRMLYFFEGLFTQSRGREAISYLKWSLKHTPNSQQPVSSALQRSIRETPSPGNLGASHEYLLQDEYIFYPKSRFPASDKMQDFRELAR